MFLSLQRQNNYLDSQPTYAVIIHAYRNEKTPQCKRDEDDSQHIDHQLIQAHSARKQAPWQLETMLSFEQLVLNKAHESEHDVGDGHYEHLQAQLPATAKCEVQGNTQQRAGVQPLNADRYHIC